MPGYVKDYVKALTDSKRSTDDRKLAYDAMRDHLDTKTFGSRDNLASLGPVQEQNWLRYDSARVRGAALEASRNIAKERYPDKIYDAFGGEDGIGKQEKTAMRQAIRDWSHENNHAIQARVAELSHNPSHGHAPTLASHMRDAKEHPQVRGAAKGRER